MLKLRFPEAHLKSITERYSYRLEPTTLLKARTVVQKGGAMSKDILRAVCEWKSPRSAGNMERNSSEFVEAVTGFALSASDERARIQGLTLLDGVGWPTASVILHFFHKDPYPILDRRALWSLGVDKPKAYESYDPWWDYVTFCRRLAKRHDLTMRSLDMALWQYSRENEPPAGL